MSRDKLLSHFCETPSIWGGKQNTLCLGFAKGLRFLNMVMTFVLYPLSHYNSITEPRAQFLLSLLEDLFIDFPSHFITSILDVYQDMMTRDKLIFPSAITRILCHFSIPFLILPTSPPWVPSTSILFDGARPALTEEATCGDCWSCSFNCSFLLRSFFLGRWCDPRGYHGAASAHGCSLWHSL